jgi:predicted dehydrogenase
MRLALVGCGAAAEHLHLPAIRRVLGADAIWLVDPDLRRARSLARRRDHVAATHGEVLGEVDAAIVAVPNDLHVPVAGDLLRAGVRVLCEKPLGRNAAEVRALAAAADAGGATLAVGHFRRFFSSSRLAREAIDELGSPRAFAVTEGSVFGWDAHSAYSLDPQRAGGGVLLDVGTHVLDQLRLILGDLELRDYLDDAHGGLEADCAVELTAGNVAGTLELSRTRTLGSSLVVECERGTVSTTLAVDAPVQIEREGEVAQAGVQSDDSGHDAAFEAQLRDFLDGGTWTAGANEALAIASFIDRCYAKRMPLPEPWVRETMRP